MDPIENADVPALTPEDTQSEILAQLDYAHTKLNTLDNQLSKLLDWLELAILYAVAAAVGYIIGMMLRALFP